MNEYLSPEVDKRFAKHKEASMSENPTSSVAGSRSVVDLALTAYLKGKSDARSSARIDPIFKEIAINQMKLFLFSGHDTTSSTVCYVLYLLSIYPTILSRLREEHEKVFGSSPSQVSTPISQCPHLLNKLPYTTAVIKESMRLFPAASTTRSGEPGFKITDSRNGLKYPAEPGTLIWLVSHACQRDPASWPRATQFLPERWLAKEGDELFPKQGAWRPFEHGPRSCIGKELSMLELKIVICLTARRFEISAAYDKLDAAMDARRMSDKVRTVNGERAYQVGKGEP
ncbi:MAG: hypothetical protein Q9217_006556, partial [Psora testacea]